MRRAPGLTWLVTAGAAAGLAIAPFGPAAAGQPGPEPRNVVGAARAQGVRATYTIPDYVVVSEFFDGGGPVAEALADSTGQATSFSSLPWPGENAVTAPGTVSVALGQSVPLSYPFHVRADHPTTPSAQLSDPTGSYSLAASARDGAAAAAGALEGTEKVSGSRAGASAVLDDGGVVRVLAETVDTGISVGDGLLRVASVRSRSETTLAPSDAAPVTRRSLVVEGATVAGQPVTIDAEGVRAAGQGVAAPVGQGLSSQSELLGQAGISVRVVPTGAPGGADALVIESSQTIPAPNNPKGTLVLRLGGAASEVVVGSADLPVDAPAVSDRGVAEETAGPTSAGPAGTAAGAAAGAGVAGPLPSAPVPPVPPVGPVARSGRPAALPLPRPQPLDFPLPAVSEEAAAVSGAAALPPQPAALRRAVVQPDLATTGALYSLLGTGGLAVVLATRLSRLRRPPATKVGP